MGFFSNIFGKSDENKANDFYKVYTPNGLEFVRRLEEISENNQSIPFVGEIKLYQKMFGEFPSSARKMDEFEKAIGISGYADEAEGTLKCIAGDYLTTLAAHLAQRYTSQYLRLKSIGEKEAMEKFGLNIHSDEFIHDNLDLVDWYEEKTVTTSHNYGGFQYRLGSSNGVSYRMGNLNVITNTAQKFSVVDRGMLYITNQRIIFVGTDKRVNKTINLDDILEFSIFTDGILLGKANGKKPLIKFPEWVMRPNKAPNKRDHLTRIVRVLDRVLRQNQNENLPAEDNF